MDADIKQEIKLEVEKTQIYVDCIKEEQQEEKQVYIKEEMKLEVENTQIYVDCIKKEPMEEKQCLISFYDNKPITEPVYTKQEDTENQIKFENNMSNRGYFDCIECVELYKGFCLNCSPLSHILNASSTTSKMNMKETIPSDILEICDTSERKGVFALKNLQKNVIFGPFEGLKAIESASGWIWKIKNKKFNGVENANWMQYVNCADRASFNNLEVLQFNGDLYFQTTSEINEGEELLVWFNREDMGRSNDEEQSYYIPVKQEKSQNVFVCTLCYLGFSQDKHLIVHKSKCLRSEYKRNITESIQCVYCNVLLEKQEYLENHMSSCLEKIPRKYSFPAALDLTKTRTQTDVEERMGSNENVDEDKNAIGNANTFKCSHCSYETNHKGSLKMHIETTKHTGDIKNYKCSHCSYETNRKANLIFHIRSKHTVGDVKDFKCSQCDYETNHKRSLKMHIEGKHTVGAVKDFKCLHCSYETNVKGNLKIHNKNKHTVGDVKNFKCLHCSYETNTKSHLKMHMKNKHTVGDVKDFKCLHCSYETNFRVNLEMHIKSKHGNVKDFKCFHCSYEANRKSHLETHIKAKHTIGDMKDFKCSHCSYATNNKSLLKMHIKNKHIVEGGRDFKCSHCSYETNIKNLLKMHIKNKHRVGIGKDFNCSHCSYETNNKHHLKMHIKNKHAVDGVKDFKCSYCSYKTNRKDSLNLHIRSKHVQMVM